MTKLTQTLSAWKRARVLVLGDVMLDEYVHGNADRISPEAPVPILHVKHIEHRAGGAANLCLNLAALGAEVHIVGIVGDDDRADRLRNHLTAAGIKASGLVGDPSRPTTLKQRLVGLAQHRHPQTMFRVDHESTEPILPQVQHEVIDRVREAIASVDVVCIEDYNKGVCTTGVCQAVIELCKRHNVEVIVDPAPIADFGRYHGATAITPNRMEATRAARTSLPDDAGPDAFTPIARTLAAGYDIPVVAVTLDREGALLCEARVDGKDERITHVPTIARQVYDVTGAGDMVIAAMAAARANGLDWIDATRLANVAAGLEVEQFGVVPIPIERIHAELIRQLATGSAKVLGLDDLTVQTRAAKADGKQVVFTNGCFDLLHAGHLSLLRRAAACGDYLVVAVNSDASVRRLGKGEDRPINTEQDRAELLAGLECVDAVVIFDEDTPARAIEAVVPDVLVKGAEYSMDQVPGARFVQEHGGRVELLSMIDGKSTTSTVSRIRAAQAQA